MIHEANTLETMTRNVGNAAAAGGVYFGLTANELAAFASVIIAFLAYVTNALITWHFKSQHLKLARENANKQDDESGD